MTAAGNKSFWQSLLLAAILFQPVHANDDTKHTSNELGSAENPLIISLLPERLPASTDADKGLQLPEFLRTGPRQALYFKLLISTSYSQSVDDFCNGVTHLAALSMITYAELKKRCDKDELLAIAISGGQAFYHSGIFTHRKNLVRSNRALSFHKIEKKTIAFGSQYSTTSFHYPLKLLLDFGLTLPDDLDEIYMTGSHSAAIEKLVRGEVELAAASFQSWKAAIDNGTIDPMLFMPLAKSPSIPLPPLVMSRSLPDKTKKQIRRLFKEAHDGSAEYITGVRGRRISRYDVDTPQQEGYLESMEGFESVEIDLIERVVDKADEYENQF